MNPAEMAEGKPLAWHIRPVAPRDVPNLRSLCAALGYPVGEDQLADRLSHIMALDQHAIFIASDGEDQMLGWVHVYECPLLIQAPGAELGGLVVDACYRRQGIGQALLCSAEKWIKERGLTLLSIRSNTAHRGAHTFYQALHYDHIKTSHTYKKAFSAST